MPTVTKISPSFVPSAAPLLLLGAAMIGGVTVCALQRHTPEQRVARPAAAAAAYPVREIRPETESAAQVEGMSEDAENALVHRTDFYWHHGDYPRIIGLDRVVTELDPQDVETYSTGGWLMESLGDDLDAEAYYAQGMARNPLSSYAAYSLAVFYYNTMHEYPKAEAVLTKSVHDPDAGVLDWKTLAHTYERENRYDKAVETWEKIKRDYPKAPAIESNLQRDEAILAKSSQTPPAPTPNGSPTTVSGSTSSAPTAQAGSVSAAPPQPGAPAAE